MRTLQYRALVMPNTHYCPLRCEMDAVMCIHMVLVLYKGFFLDFMAHHLPRCVL